MLVLNVEDEKNRLYDIRYFLDCDDGQLVSHGCSYLYRRGIQRDLGFVMGFDDPNAKVYKRRDV